MENLGNRLTVTPRDNSSTDTPAAQDRVFYSFLRPQHMLLPRDQALRFINGYKSMLLRVLANTGTAETDNVNSDLATARSLGSENPSLFESALSDLEAVGNPVEPAVVDAIRSLKIGLWLYLKHGKTYAVFLDKEVQNAYAVRALTTPLNELLDEPPFVVETGVFEFEGSFVCDGLVLNPVALLIRPE